MNKFASLNDEIKKKIITPLSGEQLSQMGFNMVPWSDLRQKTTVDEICTGPMQGCILFIPTEAKYSGHWICLFIRGNTLFYFCSYGTSPKNIAQLSDYMIATSIPDEYWLDPLLQNWRNRGGLISINKTRYQDLKDSTSTCGRYCALRLIKRDLNHDEFRNWFRMNRMHPDTLVTLLTFVI
jgi:hypothetical protein